MSVSDILNGAFHFRKTIKRIENRNNPLIVSEVRLGGLPPERIATPIPIDPDLLSEEESEAVSSSHYLGSSEKAGWLGECVVRFRVTNQSDIYVSVRAINVEKSKVPDLAKSSMLFIPQGSTAGEPWRFISNLDQDSPSMAYAEGAYPCYTGSSYANYFDEGSTEIAPDETSNFLIHLRANENSFKCSLYLRFQISPKGSFETIDIPTERDIFVYRPDSVSENQMFRRTYSPTKPWIAPESDKQFANTPHPFSWY